LALLVGTQTRAHENGPRAGAAAGLYVEPFVADHEGAGRIEAALARRLVDHRVSRLAAIAASRVRRNDAVRVVRAIVIRVDARAARRQSRVKAPVRLADERFVELAARNPRLVRNDNDREAGAVEHANRVDGPGIERHAAQRIEIADILDHRAVAIEKDRRFHEVRRVEASTAATSIPRMHR
jgi:hypothetical protein